MLKVQPSINEPFNITECPICSDKRPMDSLYCTVHFGMFLAVNVWLCCRDNPWFLHNVPISGFRPLLVFMLGIQSLVDSSKKHQFHCTWSGSLISFIGPNCTSVDAVCKKEYKDKRKIISLRFIYYLKQPLFAVYHLLTDTIDTQHYIIKPATHHTKQCPQITQILY